MARELKEYLSKINVTIFGGWGMSLKLIIYKLKIHLSSTFSFCYNLDHISCPEFNFHETHIFRVIYTVVSNGVYKYIHFLVATLKKYKET